MAPTVATHDTASATSNARCGTLPRASTPNGLSCWAPSTSGPGATRDATNWTAAYVGDHHQQHPGEARSPDAGTGTAPGRRRRLPRRAPTSSRGPTTRWPTTCRGARPPARHSPKFPAASPTTNNVPEVTNSQPTGWPSARRTTSEPTARSRDAHANTTREREGGDVEGRRVVGRQHAEHDAGEADRGERPEQRRGASAASTRPS